MQIKSTNTIERLVQVLNFSEFFGELVWSETRNNNAKEGEVAGYLLNTGYREIAFGNERFLAHRLIWQMHYGTIPEGIHIDHIDGNNSNNRPENLRLCCRQQNMHNQKRRSDNQSGVKGVWWSDGEQRWKACVTNFGKRHHGTFALLSEAKNWVENKRKQLHGEFANHGN